MQFGIKYRKRRGRNQGVEDWVRMNGAPRTFATRREAVELAAHYNCNHNDPEGPFEHAYSVEPFQR